MNDDKLQIIEAAAPVATDAARERKDLVKAMEREGIDEAFVAKTLAHVIKDAMCSTPTGDMVEDFGTKLAGLKLWHKMKSGQPDVQVNVAQFFPKGNI
jgi:hypothetical protein